MAFPLYNNHKWSYSWTKSLAATPPQWVRLAWRKSRSEWTEDIYRKLMDLMFQSKDTSVGREKPKLGKSQATSWPCRMLKGWTPPNSWHWNWNPGMHGAQFWWTWLEPSLLSPNWMQKKKSCLRADREPSQPQIGQLLCRTLVLTIKLLALSSDLSILHHLWLRVRFSCPILIFNAQSTSFFRHGCS